MPSTRRSSASASRPLDSIELKDADDALRFGEEMRTRLRLHDDDADAMGDHVVKLAGDPSALLADRLLRPLLTLALEQSGAVLEFGNALSPPPQVAANEPRDRER